MEKLYIDTHFEPGMSFLVDRVTNCIENRIYGFINEKNENFSVHFIFLGLKTKKAKRKANIEIHGDIKKMKSLNTSLENLAILCTENDTDEPKTMVNQSRGKKRIAATTLNKKQLEKKIKLEPRTRK